MHSTPAPRPPAAERPEPGGLNRRNVLQLCGVAGVLGTVLYLFIGSGNRTKAVHYSQPLMGTVLNMTVCGPDTEACETAVSACVARMTALTAIFSTYEADSPISRLNRDGILPNAPRELVEVFTRSRQLSQLTGGAFDPTILPLVTLFRDVKKSGLLPEREKIDEILQLVDYHHIVVEKNTTIRYTKPGTTATLDGIAKGYIVDQGIAVLREHGLNDAYVEAGGDLMTIGARVDGTPWRIGIRNPRSDDLKKMDTIRLSDRAIATSGDYLQYFTKDKKNHHIINPHSGFSPVVTASSSIIAPSVAMADGLATATMVLGPKKSLALLESLPDCEGYFFDKQLHKYQTKGFFS